MADAVAVNQAQEWRNAEARRDLLVEFRALSGGEVQNQADSPRDAESPLAERWREEGRILAVPVDGHLLYPAFQFDRAGQPLQATATVLTNLRAANLTDWEIALWFTTASGWLGGQRPVDAMHNQPETVVAAAERAAGPLVA
jgi:hypothetical protein